MDTSTALDFRAFAFIITLAAVVNGLGIVRWLTGLSEYMAQRDTLNIRHYWVFNLLAAHQFLLHVLLWWMLWNVRDAANLNFLAFWRFSPNPEAATGLVFAIFSIALAAAESVRENRPVGV